MNTCEQSPAPGGAVPAYTVTVRGLIVFASIGVTAQEREKRQRVRVSVDLVAGSAAAAALSPGEDRRRIINYDRIVGAIRKIAGAGHIDLCEGFAEQVCAVCLRDPRVERARVWIEKLDVYADTEGVGAVLERSRTR
jgi:dihydroneopterin aldolase